MNKSFLLTLTQEEWGHKTLTISNIEILETSAEGAGNLSYDLDGYDQEWLDSIGKTEQNLIDHVNTVILEMLEAGIKRKDEEILNKAKNIVDKTT